MYFIVIILIFIVLIVLNVHTDLYTYFVQGYLLVPLSIGVLLSQCHMSIDD